MPRALVSTIASLQNSMPGAGHHDCAGSVDGRDRQPELLQRRRPASRPGPAAMSRTSSFCVGGGAEPVGAVRLGEVGELGQQRAGRPGRRSGRRRRRTCRPSAGARRRGRAGRWSGMLGRRAVDQRALQVLVLQHLAELLDAPVGDQELQPGPVAQPAVAVVAEDRDDAGPDLGDLLQRHPGAEPLGQHRVGGQPAADPEVEARAVLGVDDADERDVVDLVRHVLARVAGDRGLELARQVGELRVADVAVDDVVDRRGRVDDLVGGDAGHRRAEDDARAVAAGLGGGQADGLQPAPDLRHVLDPDPVQLDVLPVGDVGGVAGEVRARSGRSRAAARWSARRRRSGPGA